MDPDDPALTPGSQAELVWVQAEADAIEHAASITCGACGREFAVPHGKGWPTRRYCDQCRDDGNARRVRRMRRGVRYRQAEAIIEERSGKGDP
jgi:hypothetical protein